MQEITCNLVPTVLHENVKMQMKNSHVVQASRGWCSFMHTSGLVVLKPQCQFDQPRHWYRIGVRHPSIGIANIFNFLGKILTRYVRFLVIFHSNTTSRPLQHTTGQSTQANQTVAYFSECMWWYTGWQ